MLKKQPLDSDLTAIASLTHNDKKVIVSDGTNWQSRLLVTADISDITGKYVSIAGNETITGAKTFSAYTIISNTENKKTYKLIMICTWLIRLTQALLSSQKEIQIIAKRLMIYKK